MRDYRKSRRAWIDSLKDKPCARCGNSYPPVAMDFHHRDPETKEFNIGPAIRYGKERILAEIAKCDLLCAVCHRLVEYGESWQAAHAAGVARGPA
ncbi:MAG: HNH endonuclease [Dehalococcoidia bacterium]|nr:HNH endonuclease [Dehalococcoidia bacterium]